MAPKMQQEDSNKNQQLGDSLTSGATFSNDQRLDHREPKDQWSSKEVRLWKPLEAIVRRIKCLELGHKRIFAKKRNSIRELRNVGCLD